MGIRTAEPADESAVREIVEAAYAPWAAKLSITPLPLVADYGELIGRGAVFVLENGELDGLIVLVPEPADDTLLVENVAVRPDRQGRGLGRRLMAFAEFRARSLGLGAVRLHTNHTMLSNIALYESLGYRRGDPVEIAGRPVVDMRKVLRKL